MPEPFAGPVLFMERGFRMHYVPVPPAVADALGDARAVVGTLSSAGGPEVPFRRALHGRSDGAPHLRFGKRILAVAGLALGDTALVEVEPADPDAVHLPPEFEAALAADPEAAERFATFSPGRQRSLGVQVAQAKRAETRERRALDLCEKIRTRMLADDRRS